MNLLQKITLQNITVVLNVFQYNHIIHQIIGIRRMNSSFLMLQQNSNILWDLSDDLQTRIFLCGFGWNSFERCRKKIRSWKLLLWKTLDRIPMYWNTIYFFFRHIKISTSDWLWELMNGIHLMVSDKKGIYNTLKENHKRGGKCFFWFSTFLCGIVIWERIQKNFVLSWMQQTNFNTW